MASYLLPSSFQKKLLRYALSHLEFLDAKTLDLEYLDIKWGTKSTLEFKDVPLHLRKLAALLKLPPTFDLTKAEILLLRITVPVDIYSSPIVVEVDGVEAQLTVTSEEDPAGGAARPRTDYDRKRKRPGSSSRAGEHGDAVLPSAADLAASFLQTEPEDEKAELEAVISSRSQNLAASIAESDDGEDDSPIGTGTGLTLPGFLANFLKGIVDRLQVRIRGIVLNLNASLPSEGSPQAGLSLAPDFVTVQVSVEDVNIEGVTTVDIGGESLGIQSGPAQARKEGKRLISLKALRGSLITDASLFASLARSSALSSPSVTHSNFSEARSRSWASRSHSIHDSEHSDANEDIGSSQVSNTSAHPRNSQASLLESVSSIVPPSESGRFDDAVDDNESIDERFTSGHLEDSVLADSTLLSHATESQFLDDELQDSRMQQLYMPGPSFHRTLSRDSPALTPRASIYMPHLAEEPLGDAMGRSIESGNDPRNILQSKELPTRSRGRLSQNRLSQSQSASKVLSPTLQSPPNQEIQAPQPGHDEHSAAEDSDSSQGSSSGEVDRLAQSTLFSHEDAESMYMSAVSHGGMSEKVPGAWGTSSHSGSEAAPDTPVVPAATHERESKPTSPDNLEHALHNSIGDTSVKFSKAISSIPSPPAATSPSSSRHSSVASQSEQMMPLSTATTSRRPSVPNSSSGASSPSESSARMSKQLFSLDQVAIYIPSERSSPEEDQIDNAQSVMYASTAGGQYDLAQSAAPNLPGAFSVHSARNPRQPRPSNGSEEKPSSTQANSPLSTEIAVGKFEVTFDISAGRLIARLLQSISHLLRQDDEPVAPTNIEQSPASPSLIQFQVESISLKFLERLVGTLHSTNAAPLMAASTISNVLLQANIDHLSIDVDTTQLQTKTSVSLQKFKFGYANENNILSFDADRHMRSSVRGLAVPSGKDIYKFEITQKQSTTTVEIETLPVHIAIDLQRLDETFSWFGGLSGVLNMGSSVASNATMTQASPIRPEPKPRSVRFETPIKPDDKSAASKNKVTARVGGLKLDLVGKQCSVAVDTSAVKLVSRDEGIGIAIGEIKISGPHIHDSRRDPAIFAEILDTRVEFLNTPKDADLDRLLSLITPSKAKYDQDDDILLETLLRQRRQGSVVRLTVDSFKTRIGNLEDLEHLPELGEEISRLSTVAKYLPEDDRPGLLSLVLVRRSDISVYVSKTIGSFQVKAEDLEAAQITFPALVALSVLSMSVHRKHQNVTEELIGPATAIELRDPKNRSPMIMARMIGDEMDPVVKVKLWNLKVEYRVPMLMALLNLPEATTTEEMAASIATSVATLTDRSRPPRSERTSRAVTPRSSEAQPLTIDIVLRECIAGLNPLGLPSKVLVVMTEGHFKAVLPKDNNSSAVAEMNKGSILVIDDVATLTKVGSGDRRRQSFDGGSSQVADLCSTGYVSVSYISSAKAIVQVSSKGVGDLEKCVDVELRDDLFVLESCADSTQTLIAVLNGLKPPTPPSTDIKYRTKVMPMADLLASLSGDAFGQAEGNYNFEDDFPDVQSSIGGEREDEGNLNLDLDSQYFHEGDLEDSYHSEDDYESREGSLFFDQGLASEDTNDGVLLGSFTETVLAEPAEELNFQEDHFGTGSILEGTAHRWNSAKNKYDRSNEPKVRKSPLKVCVRDVHIIWNLFDGYDWQHTRETITKAVQEVESKAIEKRARHDRRSTFDQDIDEEETVIGDFLFNSIYIGIPANRDPRDLAMAINQELNDNATETESIATTTVSSSPSRQGGTPRVRGKRLRLHRSKYHKITFELKGVNVDVVAFPPGSGETESSIDIRVHDFEIFDHVPSSTWKKFATYMHDAGVRQTGSSQIHIEILNVKPMPNLAASEMVLRVTVLPLRLHVDQDALDFITRFFEFKDDSAPVTASPGEAPFIQRIEVNDVVVKLDFKPKRVDYAGLRSGHTTEFMNFIVLDEANMTLKHVILYGISGFDKMGKMLNDVWMPEIKRNQLPGILAGLAPVRSLANVGGGVRNLVMVPIQEYKKDGRVVRSLRKGATSFGKTTGIELIKFGAKIAIGTQTVLQGAETLLSNPRPSGDWEDADLDDEEERKQISLYADQPIGVLQGLRGGYASLSRDLVMARDAIIAIPGEVMDSGTAQGAAMAVGRGLPTIILKPMIGVSRAVGQTLMGATNSLDPENRRRVDDKYKKH